MKKILPVLICLMLTCTVAHAGVMGGVMGGGTWSTLSGKPATPISDSFLIHKADGTLSNATSLDLALTTGSYWVGSAGVAAETTGAVASDINTGTDTVKPIASDALAGSNIGTKDVCWAIKDVDVATVVETFKRAYVVPVALNGMNLIDVTCSVADLNSATSGDTTVMLKRNRGGTVTTMTSTGVTIAFGAYTASDEVVDASYDDVATGDLIYPDVTAITSAAQKGLSCTALFRLP